MSRETLWTASALASRAFGVFFLTMAAVTALDKTASGLWFLFSSFGALVQLLDVGLSAAVLRSSSHFWAGVADLRPQGLCEVEGSGPNWRGLKDLLATTSFLYAALGFLILLGGGLGGLLLLPEWERTAGVYVAWWFYCFAAGLQLMVSQRYAYLQGAGRLLGAQKLFSFGILLTFGLAAVVLFITHSLFWGCSALAVGWLLQYILFTVACRRFKGGVWRGDLFQKLWPNSWRTGCSRLGQALIYHGPTLLMGRLLGVELAGPYGFSVQVGLFLTALAQIPMVAVLPHLHALTASGDLAALRSLFLKKIRQTLLGHTVFALSLLAAGPWALQLLSAKTHLLPLSALAALMAFFILENHRNNFVTLVSAFNEFPFWKYDVLSGVLAILGGAGALQLFGVTGMIIWLWAVQLAWNFWWPIKVGLKKIQLAPHLPSPLS